MCIPQYVASSDLDLVFHPQEIYRKILFATAEWLVDSRCTSTINDDDTVLVAHHFFIDHHIITNHHMPPHPIRP